MRTIVVAQYKENVDWLSSVNADKKVVITKDKDIPNIGRETTSYLHYIIQNYDTLEGMYIFLQGKPFDHAPQLYADINCMNDGIDYIEIGEKSYKCEEDGSPQHGGLPILQFWKDIKLNNVSLPIEFHAGAQFGVSSRNLKRYPKEYYQLLYDKTVEYKDGPWIMERTWRRIFGDMK